MIRYTVSYEHTLPELADYFAYGECLFEIWRDERGLIHRDNGPAVLIYRPEQTSPFGEAWYKDGQIHRDGAAAMRLEHHPGRVDMRWYQSGDLHRDTGPARIVQEDTTSGPMITMEHWSRRGEDHRLGGPAFQAISVRTGVITQEYWRFDGKGHRDDGPSTIERDEDTGVVTHEEWIRNGLFHRTNGPALVCRNRYTGQVESASLYRNGKEIHDQSSWSPLPR
jgi:hypothetical protein